MVLVGFKPDLWLPTGFLQCFDTVGLVIWPVKIVPEMTYYVSSGTLNPTQSPHRLITWQRVTSSTDKVLKSCTEKVTARRDSWRNQSTYQKNSTASQRWGDYKLPTIYDSHFVVQSIYGKNPLNPKKLLQKVFQLILLGFSVLYNILKVYQNRSLGKVIFFKMASKMAAETFEWS